MEIIMNASIVIPAYNEARRIKPFLSHLSQSLMPFFNDYELVFVDDGSTDTTLEVLTKFKDNYDNIKVVSYGINRGKGYAIREGIRVAKGDLIISLDADNSFCLNDIPAVINALQTSDIVVGNKYFKSRKHDSRFFIGKCFNQLVNIFFHVHIDDCLSGLKGYRRETANILFEKLHYERWLYDVEVLVKARSRNYKIKEIPITVTRIMGSRFTLFDPLMLFFQILKMKYIDKAEKW